jgi:hypothetical protein
MFWVLIALSAGSYGFTATFDDKPACEMAAAKFVEEIRGKFGGTPVAFCSPRSSN